MARRRMYKHNYRVRLVLFFKFSFLRLYGDFSCTSGAYFLVGNTSSRCKPDSKVLLFLSLALFELSLDLLIYLLFCSFFASRDYD